MCKCFGQLDPRLSPVVSFCHRRCEDERALSAKTVIEPTRDMRVEDVVAVVVVSGSHAGIGTHRGKP